MPSKIDQVTLDRIQLLHPMLRDEAYYIYTAQVVPALSGRAMCRFAFTLRSWEEQASLYAQGRTKLFDSKGNRLGIVTKAKPGQSLHNYGLALDIVLVKDTDGNGSFDTASWQDNIDFDDDGKADWMEVINVFKANGWDWGGDWVTFKDLPHVQKTFGYKWQTLKVKYENKDFITGTTYVNL